MFILQPDTQEYQDACDLMELFLESKTVLLGEELAECGAEDGDEEEEEEEEEAFVAEEVDQQAGNTNSPKPEVTTDTCSEVNSIVIPGSGGTPTIKLKMAGSPSIEDNRGEQILAKPAPTEAPVDDQERAKNEDETAAMRQSEVIECTCSSYCCNPREIWLLCFSGYSSLNCILIRYVGGCALHVDGNTHRCLTLSASVYGLEWFVMVN